MKFFSFAQKYPDKTDDNEFAIAIEPEAIHHEHAGKRWLGGGCLSLEEFEHLANAIRVDLDRALAEARRRLR